MWHDDTRSEKWMSKGERLKAKSETFGLFLVTTQPTLSESGFSG
jgi:hypothetical protein